MPELTQRTAMHIRGSGYSVIEFEIFADGKPTKIRRVTRTNGKAPYLKEVDSLVYCGEEFNLLDRKGQSAAAWIEARLSREEELPCSP